MQARLRDIYRRRSLALNAGAMLLAIVIGAFAFSGELTGESSLIGIDAKDSTWLGVGSCIVLFLTVLDLLLDWRRESALRQAAVERMAVLKQEFRAADPADPDFEEAAASAHLRYSEVMPTIPPIPERMFNRLKSSHARKVAVSKAIDQYPGQPLLVTRLRVLAGRQREADKGA